MKDPFYGRTPYKLMIIRLNDLTSLLHTLPVLRALKRRYPKTKISWLVDQRYLPLIENIDELDEVIGFDWTTFSDKIGTLHGFWEAVGMVKDLIRHLREMLLVGSFTFTSQLRYSLLAFFSGARVRIGVKPGGFLNWALLNRRMKISVKRHNIERNLSVMGSIHADLTPVRLTLPLSFTYYEKGAALRKALELEGGSYVVLIPVSSTPIKQWHAAGFAELAERIEREQDLTPVLAWDAEENEQAKPFRDALTGKAKIVGPLELGILANLFEHAAYVVGPDTGPLHLASTMGAPVVGIYGPTDPKISGPYWKPYRIVQLDPECKRRCYSLAELPEGKCRCMDNLEAEKVFAACSDLWNSFQEENPLSASKTA